MSGTADSVETPKFDRDSLLAQARERTGLADFGNMWFLEPMDRYLESSNREGQLTPAGFAAHSEVIVKGLASRLRMMDDIKRHPEILEERVAVAGVILGLPRTGSTIFHRLLASAPGMTAIRWFEAQNFAPLPGDEPGDPKARRIYAQAMMEGWMAVAPELASIHPLDTEAPDEEILVLGQMFVSTMIEGMNYVPSFGTWLLDYDQSQGHEDLKTILQYLQWQDPSRHGKKWILKSPSNLPFAELAAKAFPEALLIMTHRDPIETVPSYVSMQATLYRMSSTVDDHQTGAYWAPRLAEWMRRFERARARIGEDRFIDIDYRAVGREPLAQAERVLTRMGIPIDDGVQEAMAEFLAGNKREQRPMHDYSLERFGLDEATIRADFADYRQRYIG